jgi:hypothetical protein
MTMFSARVAMSATAGVAAVTLSALHFRSMPVGMETRRTVPAPKRMAIRAFLLSIRSCTLYSAKLRGRALTETGALKSCAESAFVR